MASQPPNQKDSNNNPGNEESKGDVQQVGLTNKEDRAGSGFLDLFDNLFKFIEAIAFVLWMIHEFVFDVHKIFLLAAISLALAGAFYLLAHKILVKWGWRILSWVAYLGCIVLIATNSASESKTYPHFKFALQIGDSLDDIVLLTNDFLAVTNFGQIGQIEGELVIPVREGQTNLTLTIWPEVDADVLEPLVMVSLPRTWALTPNWGWAWFMNGSIDIEDGVTNIPNKLAYTLPDHVILAGNGRDLPPLSITSFPQPSMTKPQGKISISARGKSPTPTSCVYCEVILVSVPTNIASRPFIKRGHRDASGNVQFVISGSDFRELKH